jgi:hypothetical protein
MLTNRRRGLIPVLYVGDPHPRVLEQLREQGFGVIVVGAVERALRLLQQFRVTVVIDDVPALPPVLRFVALGSPVILLAAANENWGAPHVRVLSRDSSAAILTEVLYQLAESYDGRPSSSLASASRSVRSGAFTVNVSSVSA